MKKTVILAVISAFCLLAVSCGSGIDIERTDTLANNFINALLLPDTEEIEKYSHPKAAGSFSDAEFLKELREIYLLEPGDELTGLASCEKKYSENTELGGKVIICTYNARIDELIYDIEITILSDEEYYGVIGFSVGFSEYPERFYGSGE